VGFVLVLCCWLLFAIPVCFTLLSLVCLLTLVGDLFGGCFCLVVVGSSADVVV